MNPARWPLAHLVAWLVFSLLGAIVAVVGAFERTTLAEQPQSANHFIVCPQYPFCYWPWAVVGALGAGLAFYGIKLMSM